MSKEEVCDLTCNGEGTAQNDNNDLTSSLTTGVDENSTEFKKHVMDRVEKGMKREGLITVDKLKKSVQKKRQEKYGF